MKCPNCGTELSFGVEVCPSCGTVIVEKKQKFYNNNSKNSGDIDSKSTLSKVIKILIALIVTALVAYIILYFTVFHTLKNAKTVNFSGDSITTIMGMTKKEAYSAKKAKNSTSETIVFKYKINKIDSSDITKLKDYLSEQEYEGQSLTSENYLFVNESSDDGYILTVKLEKTTDNYIFTYSKVKDSISNYELIKIDALDINTSINYSISNDNYTVSYTIPYNNDIVEESTTMYSYLFDNFIMTYQIYDLTKKEYINNLIRTYINMITSTLFTNEVLENVLTVTINKEDWNYRVMSYTYNSQVYREYYFYRNIDNSNMIEIKFKSIDKELLKDDLIKYINISIEK